MRKAPTIDEDRIRKVYEILKDAHIQLDSDPLSLGPKRFNNKLARTRSLLSRIDSLFLQVSEDIHFFKRQLLKEKTLLEMEKRELLVNDISVRAGRSAADREAAALIKLRTRVETIHDLEIKYQDLEMLMIAIKAKRTDLKDIQGRMKDQLKIMEHELSLGSRWGNQQPKNTIDESTFNKIDSLIEGMETEKISLHDDTLSKPDQAEGVHSNEPNEATAFLDNLETQNDLNQDDLLAELGEIVDTLNPGTS